MPNEQQILKLIRQLIPDSKKYLFDDAATIENGYTITTDSLVENTHFTLKHYKPYEIGWKALAINLSDIASMGARPLYALISLSLPKTIKLNWIKGFYKGLNSCAKKYKTQIIGGNLARSKEINITVTLIGKTFTKNIGKRSNAKEGDLIFVTGTFGDSACGFLLLGSKKKGNKLVNHLIKVHKMPIPEISLGQKITKLTKRVALMDASDGFADCLIQIAKESKVKIIVEEDKIPISLASKIAAKKLNASLLNLALYGGEDYKLVGTASKDDCKQFKNIKIIGEIIKGNGAFLKQKNNKIVKLDMKKAFAHFN